MKKFASAALAATGFAVVAGLSAAPAHAISCKGAYQMTSNGPIATPYCEDNSLEQVARGYGIRVSNRTTSTRSVKFAMSSATIPASATSAQVSLMAVRRVHAEA